jgi:hypothetical protein
MNDEPMILLVAPGLNWEIYAYRCFGVTWENIIVKKGFTMNVMKIQKYIDKWNVE